MVLPSQALPTRNIQLDFFRGVALMVVFINHMPDNPWFWYTPSRFGLSDAADVFVFLSGFASALAYGRCFERAGLWLGTVRILHRCSHIYGAHLASFVLLALICVMGNRWVPEMDDIQRLNIAYFFDTTQQALYDLFTLAYVPNYFDILPMYLVMLSWLPLFWLLSRLHVAVAMGCSVALYWATWHYGWEFTADPASGRPWYFNPLSWQLLFFTGFAFGAGWLKIAINQSWLLAMCCLIVLVSIPLEYESLYQQSAFWSKLRLVLEPWFNKSHLGLLRCVHLLALAYLMRHLIHWQPQWLSNPLSSTIVTMGQQSLAIFLFSMLLSYAGGIALDRFGREQAFAVAVVNLSGLASMLITGYIIAWLDSKPWKTTTDKNPVQYDHGSATPGFVRHYSWNSQILALPFLMGLAVLPTLLIDQVSATSGVSGDLVVQIQPTQELQPAEALTPEIDADNLIDGQKQL